MIPGIITMYGKAEVPSGYLLCDGQAVSRATYVALFAIIGTTYGEGDGSTTFNVPDLGGRAIIGKQGDSISIIDISSLVSWWKMEGNSNDSKGSNHGTDTGMSYSKSDGKINKGGHFVGGGSYISLPSGVKPTGQFTVVAFVKTTSAATGEVFTCWALNGSAYGGILLRVESTGVVSLFSAKNTGTSSGTDFQYTTGKAKINDGNWHMIAGVWDGSNLKVYVDGILDGSVSWGNAPAYGATTYNLIGSRKDTGAEVEPFVGSIDEVIICNAAISAADILKIYEQSFATLGVSGGGKTINIAHSHTMATHSHTFSSGSTSGPSSNISRSSGSQITAATNSHTHTVTAATVGNQSDAGTNSQLSTTQSILMQSLTLYPLIKT